MTSPPPTPSHQDRQRPRPQRSQAHWLGSVDVREPGQRGPPDGMPCPAFWSYGRDPRCAPSPFLPQFRGWRDGQQRPRVAGPVDAALWWRWQQQRQWLRGPATRGARSHLQRGCATTGGTPWWVCVWPPDCPPTRAPISAWRNRPLLPSPALSPTRHGHLGWLHPVHQGPSGILEGAIHAARVRVADHGARGQLPAPPPRIG